MGLSEEELPEIVDKWRDANPHITRMWYEIQDAAIKSVETGGEAETHGLIFRMEGDLIYGQSFLTVQLPSRRKLYYPRAHLETNRFGRPAIHYNTVGQQTKKWGTESTYGGKLTENIVQAIARDCLAVTLDRIAARGWRVVFHVHDEVIVDAPMDVTVEDLCAIMAEPIPWAPELILKGAGFEGEYYRKD